MKEKTIGMKSNVKFEVFDKDGNLKQVEEHNLVLDDGLDLAACLLTNVNKMAFAESYLKTIAVGDDNTAALVTDTELLGTELGYVSPTSNSSPSTGLARFVATFAAGVGTGTWGEAVIADTNAAKSSRNCACRVAPINIVKLAGDSITVTWDITFA